MKNADADIELADRRKLLGLVAGVAAVSATQTVSAATADKPANFPRQGWAHLDGLINLQPNSGPKTADELLDYVRIEQVFARYGIAYDEGRSAVLSTLFTDDAVVENGKGSGTPFQTLHGHQAVIENFAEVWRQQGDQRRHCISNVVIESLTAKSATALAYGIVTVAAQGIIVGATVIYRGQLQRGADNLWRFSHLFIGLDDYTTPAPKVESR